MLKIDNREEIKQYLLKETGSTEVTEKILALLVKQDVLSMIYEYQKENDPGIFHGQSYLSPFELIELFAAILTLADYSNRAYKKGKVKINNIIKMYSSKEEIKFKDLPTEIIKRLKIRETSKEETTNIEENKES